jgi:hypothetical protein
VDCRTDVEEEEAAWSHYWRGLKRYFDSMKVTGRYVLTMMDVFKTKWSCFQKLKCLGHQRTTTLAGS